MTIELGIPSPTPWNKIEVMKKISIIAQSDSVTFGSTITMINCLLFVPFIVASKSLQITSQTGELQGWINKKFLSSWLFSSSSWNANAIVSLPMYIYSISRCLWTFETLNV